MQQRRVSATDFIEEVNVFFRCFVGWSLLEFEAILLRCFVIEADFLPDVTEGVDEDIESPPR